MAETVRVIRVMGKSANVNAAWFANHGVVDETPSGVVDNNNTIFHALNSRIPIFVIGLFINGQKIKQGSGALKYTISGNTITMGTAPQIGDDITITYFY